MKRIKNIHPRFFPGTLSVVERICASKKRYDTSWIDTSVSCDRFPPGQVFTILRLRTRDCGLGEVKLWCEQCEHSNLSTRPLVSSSPHRLVSSPFILSPPQLHSEPLRLFTKHSLSNRFHYWKLYVSTNPFLFRFFAFYIHAWVEKSWCVFECRPFKRIEINLCINFEVWVSFDKAQ